MSWRTGDGLRSRPQDLSPPQCDASLHERIIVSRPGRDRRQPGGLPLVWLREGVLGKLERNNVPSGTRPHAERCRCGESCATGRAVFASFHSPCGLPAAGCLYSASLRFLQKDVIGTQREQAVGFRCGGPSTFLHKTSFLRPPSNLRILHRLIPPYRVRARAKSRGSTRW